MEEKKVEWDELDKYKSTNSGKFFRPETKIPYKIVIKSADLVEKPFKEGEKPRLTAVIVLASIDGNPSELIWETRSWKIINKLKQYRDNGLGKLVFLLEKETENGKTTYTFAKCGEVNSKGQQQPLANDSEDYDTCGRVGAFL